MRAWRAFLEAISSRRCFSPRCGLWRWQERSRLPASHSPQRFGVLKLDREIDLGWNISRLVVIALKKARLELFLVNIKTLVKNELAGANCSALANDEDASGGDGLLAIETDDIYIDTGGKKRLADDRPDP